MATPTERIFEKLEEISVDLAVVKSKLPDIAAQAADHDKRLRSLEARVWYALGAVGLLAFAVPLIQTYLIIPT